MSDYQARVSGPLMDRIDIRIDVPAVSATDLLRQLDGRHAASDTPSGSLAPVMKATASDIE